jgi:predicted GNAT family N-acyltransferase
LLYEDDDLVGVAALKVLQESYRTTLSTKSGVSVSKAAFPYELGYIFVAPEARGNRYSERLVASALRQPDREASLRLLAQTTSPFTKRLTEMVLILPAKHT